MRMYHSKRQASNIIGTKNQRNWSFYWEWAWEVLELIGDPAKYVLFIYTIWWLKD